MNTNDLLNLKSAVGNIGGPFSDELGRQPSRQRGWRDATGPCVPEQRN